MMEEDGESPLAPLARPGDLVLYVAHGLLLAQLEAPEEVGIHDAYGDLEQASLVFIWRATPYLLHPIAAIVEEAFSSVDDHEALIYGQVMRPHAQERGAQELLKPVLLYLHEGCSLIRLYDEVEADLPAPSQELLERVLYLAQVEEDDGYEECRTHAQAFFKLHDIREVVVEVLQAQGMGDELPPREAPPNPPDVLEGPPYRIGIVRQAYQQEASPSARPLQSL